MEAGEERVLHGKEARIQCLGAAEEVPLIALQQSVYMRGDGYAWSRHLPPPAPDGSCLGEELVSVFACVCSRGQS